MPITITVTAETPDLLASALRDMLAQLRDDGQTAAVVTDPTDATTADVSVATDTVEGKASQENVSDQDNGLVKDLTPEEARDKAIIEMQKVFSADAGAMKHVAELQRKYAIKAFKDVDLSRAHDLLADVLLIANGNAS